MNQHDAKVDVGYGHLRVKLPVSFNLNKEVDPMAKKCLDERYGDTVYEVLDFLQRGGRSVGDVTVAMSGVYLVTVCPKEGSEQMHIVKVNCIDYAYFNDRPDLPRSTVEKSFTINNGTEANLIIDTFTATKNAII